MQSTGGKGLASNCQKHAELTQLQFRILASADGGLGSLATHDNSKWLDGSMPDQRRGMKPNKII